MAREHPWIGRLLYTIGSEPSCQRARQASRSHVVGENRVDRCPCYPDSGEAADAEAPASERAREDDLAQHTRTNASRYVIH